MHFRHNVYYGQNKWASTLTHTPPRPQGCPDRQGRSGQDGPAKIYVCLQLGISFNAEHSILELPRATPPSLAVDPDHQNAIHPLALTSLFHPLLDTHPASYLPLHKAVFQNVEWGGRVVFRQISHCVCAYFHDNGTAGVLAVLPRTAFERTDGIDAFLLKH